MEPSAASSGVGFMVPVYLFFLLKAILRWLSWPLGRRLLRRRHFDSQNYFQKCTATKFLFFSTSSLTIMIAYNSRLYNPAFPQAMSKLCSVSLFYRFIQKKKLLWKSIVQCLEFGQSYPDEILAVNATIFFVR
mmetsp:Transcript_2823/g.6084  ORF Transcript_2823/g.6084 Transcript_2823/m.6084 type:complete len:133 (+) Transcript_2823:1828-2226(+)